MYEYLNMYCQEIMIYDWVCGIERQANFLKLRAVILILRIG